MIDIVMIPLRFLADNNRKYALQSWTPCGILRCHTLTTKEAEVQCHWRLFATGYFWFCPLSRMRLLVNSVWICSVRKVTQCALAHEFSLNLSHRASNSIYRSKAYQGQNEDYFDGVHSWHGGKVPLAMIGKSKSPRRFVHLPEKVQPLAYQSQINAWFTQIVTEWWILMLFKPHNERKFGRNCCAILHLDDC